MSQFFIGAIPGSTSVTSVTGTNGVTASPTTGAVVVSGVNATTSTVGVASFNPADFTVSGGAVTLLNGPGVGSVTAGTNLNNSGTTANPIINLNSQILQPDGSTAAPSYSFAAEAGTGMYYNTGQAKLAFSVGNNEAIEVDGSNLVTNVTNNQFNGGVNIGSYFCPNYTNPGSYPYTVQSTDYYISVNSSAGAPTINFPNAPRFNITYIVKDRTGNAGTNNITLTTPAATILFDGSTTYVIDSNYGSVQLMWNGTNFEVF